MTRRSAKPRDLNSMAAAIVAQRTDPEDQGDDPYEGKNPGCGRAGGSGGLGIRRAGRRERRNSLRSSEVVKREKLPRLGGLRGDLQKVAGKVGDVHLLAANLTQRPPDISWRDDADGDAQKNFERQFGDW